MGNTLTDLWNNAATWQVSEGCPLSEKADGKNPAVLGTVRGAFFFPDGVSENKRFYPSSLWHRVLQETRIQKKINDRLMLGKIGHDDRPVSDQDIQEGIVSHIVSSLYIDSKGIGMGEALILDTPAGRNLWTLLKAGSKIKISSRATGAFLEGANHQGMPVVDPESYLLETFDFVLNAGFGATDPRLTESLQPNNKNKKMETDLLVNRLMENRDNAQASLTEALSKNHQLERRIAELEGKLQASNSSEHQRVQYLGESIARKYGAGSISTLLERLERIDPAVLNLVERTNLSEAALNEYVDLGTPEEISEAAEAAIHALESYIDLGTVSEIEHTLDLADQALTGYLSLGTIEELSERLSRLDELEEILYENEVSEKILEKSRQYGVDVALVESLINQIGTGEELDNLLESTASPKNSSEVISKGLAKFSMAPAGRLFESLNSDNKTK